MFKKLFSIFAALTLSVGLWAETVSYLYPVYNEGDATKGIQKWETTTVEATAVTSSTAAINAVTWGTAGQTTWFVVKGEDVQLTKGAVCAGDVRLILADNAKLTAKATTKNAGIQVSNGNSLTIYAQSTGTQMGQLIAECSTMVGDAAGIGGSKKIDGSNITINGGIITATGGKNGAAGIGGGSSGSGTDITINGGTVTATGGQSGAGIGGGTGGAGSNITINGGTITANNESYAAGIGGGSGADGSNIIINGGTVTAKGGSSSAAGIGGGKGGSASDIFVATNLIVKAGTSADPTDEIAKTRTATTDIASDLAGKQYATIAPKPKGNLTVESFVVSDNNVIYNGEAKAATVEFADGIIGAGEMTVTYKQGTTVIASPISTGEYDIYVAVAEGDSYNAFEATKVSTLTIAKATPTVDLFTFTAPDDLTWDGNTKTATVTFNDPSGKLSGMGTVTVKYNGSTDAPSATGDYTVSIDVAEGTNFACATDLTYDAWKFTIVDPYPHVGDQFVDETSGLKFEITAIDPTATVKVINNDYEGTSYTIPASVSYKDVAFAVTEIGEAAFINCSDLTTITFAEGSQVTTIGEAAFNECWSLISIALPSSVTTIGPNAFSGCSELPSINLASVTEIGVRAFMGCEQLSSLDIPASLTTIGEDAFILCENIYDVTVHWESAAQLPIMGNGVFGGIAGDYGPAGATLHVPAGSASVYDVAPWNTFGTIDDPQFVLPDKTAGQYATICLPKPIAGVTNGVLYKISYGNIYEVHFVEEANFTADPAGTPYLVQAEADGDIVFTMADAEPVTAPVGVETAKGFVASLQEGLQDMPEGYNYLLVSGGVLHSAGPGCQLSKNHAYIDINYVPAEAPEPQGAPRRVVLYNAERQMPTGLYQTQDTKHEIQKLLRNGQMLIIRENKVYNAQGQIVK